MKNLSFWSALSLILLMLAGCAPGNGSEPKLPRAQPAFMQWMMRESLKEQAREMIAEVSQSGRMWLNSGTGHSPDVLLKATPDWLETNPRTAASKLPLFRVLSAEAGNIARFGFTGIFLGPTGERPEIWASKEMGSPAGSQGFDRNTASLKFDPSAGNAEDFERLAASAEREHLQLGSDLIGAATGIGPDFLLSSRKANGYGGLYAMLSAPDDVWDDLPPASGEWDFQALDKAQVESLVAKGVLPKAVGRDAISWASSGGWAVTGPVIGTDGQARRWLYRYSGGPMKPVMQWQDPSGSARQAFSGAVIASTGLNRESLVGIRLEPLIGLEAAASGQSGAERGLAPMLGALDAIASEIHRYGGWALQADPLPAEAMEAVLSGPCDFCRDAVTPALVAAAMLDGNAAPLASLYNYWMAKKVKQKRLARGLNDAEGIHWNVVPKLPQAGRPASLEELKQAFAARGGKNTTPDSFYEMLFAWRLGLPGFAFISAGEMEQLGENFTSSIFSNSSRGKQNATTARLRKLLEVRRSLDMANARVVAVNGGANGAMAILSALPEGGYWLMACNFGGKKAEAQINLPQKAHGARDAATGASLNAFLNGTRMRVPLDAMQARHVVLQAKGVLPEPDAAEPAEQGAQPEMTNDNIAGDTGAASAFSGENALPAQDKHAQSPVEKQPAPGSMSAPAGPQEVESKKAITQEAAPADMRGRGAASAVQEPGMPSEVDAQTAPGNVAEPVAPVKVEPGNTITQETPPADMHGRGAAPAVQEPAMPSEVDAQTAPGNVAPPVAPVISGPGEPTRYQAVPPLQNGQGVMPSMRRPILPPRIGDEATPGVKAQPLPEPAKKPAPKRKKRRQTPQAPAAAEAGPGPAVGKAAGAEPLMSPNTGTVPKKAGTRSKPSSATPPAGAGRKAPKAAKNGATMETGSPAAVPEHASSAPAQNGGRRADGEVEQ